MSGFAAFLVCGVCACGNGFCVGGVGSTACLILRIIYFILNLFSIYLFLFVLPQGDITTMRYTWNK